MSKLQLNLNDEKYIINKYEESFKENGFSSESVLWTKEKQEIRFNKLPFDYTIIIYKDDSYNEKAIFNEYGIC